MDGPCRLADLPLAIGIGLNYGPAVLGDVGTASFTVIGDTVNIASRLQDLTRELKTPLVVADAILRQIGGGQPPDPAALPIKLACQGERELRGRSARVRIWSPPTK
jgi:adenylate cyclase